MSIFKFLVSKVFLRQLLYAFLFLIVLFWIAVYFLKIYTRHGKTIEVPDLIGQRLEELYSTKHASHFKFIVVDSIFDDSRAKGSIVLQDPPAGSIVKPGRKIYLTIVATQPEMVVMPDLVDLTLRKAILEINASRLSVERLVFQYDIARNAVLEQRYQGMPILPGTRIPRGSAIELVVGKGLKDEKIPVPDLIGKTLQEAIILIFQSSFNLGKIHYREATTMNTPRVYRQSPPGGPGQLAEFGTSITLWVTSDANVDFNAYREQYQEDIRESSP